MSIPSKLQEQKSEKSIKNTKNNQRLVRRAEPFANALFSVALETLSGSSSEQTLNVTGLISKTTKYSSKIEFFEIYQNIDSIYKAFSTEADIIEFFENPLISNEKKKTYFLRFFPTINQKIKNLVSLLIDNNKSDLISEVLLQSLKKYWQYLQILQYDLVLGKFGNQLEANFVAYQFSEIITDLPQFNDKSEKSIKLLPALQVKNKYKISKEIIGGFSLGFSQGTGFLNFTASNEFNKFFGRIDKRSSN